MSQREKIAVIGAGSWGTAIANLLAKNGHEVKIWARESEVCDGINNERRNPKYLSDILLGEMLATTSIEEAVKKSDIIVNGVPTTFVRDVMSTVNNFTTNQHVVSLTKGIEIESGLRPTQILNEVLGDRVNSISVLSGPNLAKEIAREVPSATVIASENLDAAKRLQKAFMTPYFRVYTNHDLVGVELGGALKNVIALAAGISDGIGFGENTKASLITRGLAEMKNFVLNFGGEVETVSGLSGIGDLIATCGSPLSRNRTFGEMIGRGMSKEEAGEKLGMVAEGVKTSIAVKKIAEDLGIEMPICFTVEEVLYQKLSPKDAVKKLMTREAKHEVVKK